MNNTRTLAIVAVLTAATLVLGGTLTATTTQSAFAAPQKKPGHDDNKKTRGNGSGNGNGNTVTIEQCKNRGSASGFDTAVNQECENLICTHPGENATCTQEGVRSTPTSTPTPTPTPEPITTTLRIIKQVDCQSEDPNCSLPNDCTISLFTSSQQSFTCKSAIGNGVLFTLQPGDSFNVLEAISGGFTVSTRGDCGPSTIAEGQHVTCTIINTEIP
jgi:hypothetical protein